MQQPLFFEYVDDASVCELTTDYAAMMVAYQHYQEPVSDERRSYEVYCYEMLSFLRFLPNELQSKPVAYRMNEEVLRNMLAHMICTRKDLVENFFKRSHLEPDEIAEMWRLFKDDLPIPTRANTDERLFKNRDNNTKQAICDLINNLVTKDETPLMTPAISLAELEALLSTGNCEQQYVCNNQQWFAFIMHHLAQKKVLQPSRYWKILCCKGKLWAPARIDSNGVTTEKRVLQREDLSNAYNQIRSDKTPIYATFDEYLNKVIH